MEIDNRKKIPESHMEYLPGMEVLEKSDLMDRVLKAAAEYRPESYTSEDVRAALERNAVTL